MSAPPLDSAYALGRLQSLVLDYIASLDCGDTGAAERALVKLREETAETAAYLATLSCRSSP